MKIDKNTELKKRGRGLTFIKDEYIVMKIHLNPWAGGVEITLKDGSSLVIDKGVLVNTKPANPWNAYDPDSAKGGDKVDDDD